MWIMERWKKFSQNQWNKWGSKLQSQYDAIDAWEDEDLKKMFKALWDVVPKNLQDKLTAFIVGICTLYGEEFAKKIIEKLFPNFEKKNK